MNLIDLLTEMKIPFRTAGQDQHAREGWINIDCPFCSKGRGRFRLGINLAGGYCNCWNCGGHRLSHVLSEATSTTRYATEEILKQLKWKRTSPIAAKHQGKLVLPHGIGDLQPAHHRYLKQRGFDPDVIAKVWGVRGLALAGCLSWRLFIPIIYEGEVVSWTTRSIGEAVDKKYVNAKREEESLSPKRLLYGSDYARNAIIIHEGPIDVWATGPGAVATMGLSFSRQQANLMSRYAIRVVCFDAEAEAQRRAERLADYLQVFPGETHVVVLETGKDSAEADRDEVLELRKRFLGD